MNKVSFILIGFLLSIATINALQVDYGTVALWQFNEGTNSTINDSTNNGNTGTISGNTTWTGDSISGYALEFNGVDNKVNIVKTSSVDIVSNLTLEASIKRKSSDDGMILSKNGPYFIAIRNNVTMGGIYANDGNCPSSCVTPGANTWTEVYGTSVLQKDTWYNIKMVYDGVNIYIYVNDSLENATSKTGQMPQVSQQVNLGWGDPGHNQFFNGTIDDVRISNISRSTGVNTPIINLTSPNNYNAFSNNSNSLNFTFNRSSIIPLTQCNLTLDNISQNSNGSLELQNISLGNHVWYVSCTDNKGNVGYSQNRSFWITSDISNMTYFASNSYGLINWTSSLNLSDGLDWSQYISISNNKVEINSSAASALNRSARITLKNITWNSPRLLKNGAICGTSEGCTQVSYNQTSGDFIFDVTGFSTYETGETPVPTPVPSGGGGGGGGGGGSNVVTVASINKTQNDTFQTINQNLSFSNNVSNEKSRKETVKNKDSTTSSITGAAIGASIQRYWLPSLIFIVVVLGLWVGLKIRRRN